MREPVRLGPADHLGATVSTQPIDGGTLVQTTCTLAAPLEGGRLHRLAALNLPDADGPAFAAGFWYAADGSLPFGDVATLPFPYYTYRKVKWRKVLDGEHPYHAAAHLKFPLLAAYCATTERWHGLLFQPFLELEDCALPVYFSIIHDGTHRRLVVAANFHADVHVDKHAWFGLGTTTQRAAAPPAAGTTLRFDVAELTALGWPELMAMACRAPLLPQPPPQPTAPQARLHHAMEGAWRFLARAEDTERGALVHLLRRAAPGQVSEEFKHSHITPELHALQLAAEFSAAGAPDAKARYDRWCPWAQPGVRREEVDDACWWHTTTRVTTAGLHAFTHHGAGFVGFPGGQATNARHLAETYHATGDEAHADAALATARWVLPHQRPDGAWPATVPVAREVRVKPPTEGRPCVAATAECVRALLAAYTIDNARTWLEAADRGLAYVNRAASFFAAAGYLRDAAPTEPDGLTAECAIHANLDRARFGPPDAYVASARQWAWYGVQWTRPLAPEDRGAWVVDGLGHTITPRIDVWSALLLGRAWARLGAATDDPFWTRLGWRQLEACMELQERDGGFAETWWYDWPDGLCPVPIESTFLALAFLDLARRFDPAWVPPPPVSPAAADTPTHSTIPGPAGLTFEFAEVDYPPTLAGLRRPLLQMARRRGPRSLSARALGLLRLLAGDEEPPGPAAPRPLRRLRVHLGAIESSVDTWRAAFRIAGGAEEDTTLAGLEEDATLTVPCLRVSGAATVSADAERLLVRAQDGSHWHVHVGAQGNVLAEPDATFRFEFAANWGAGVDAFIGEIACTRHDELS